MDNNNKFGLENISKMYENLTYFDQYGSSVLLLILITIVLLLVVAYCHIMINIKPIADDWVNQRCKPYIMPFAGLITKPDSMSVTDFTAQNFNYCTQGILSSITGTMVEPLTYIVNVMNSTIGGLSADLDGIRAMFNKIRNFFETIFTEIMGRIMNIMIPLQQIIISFKDLISKIQGSMTAGLFTLLGSYYALKSLLGAIAQFIIIILIGIAALIVIFWLIPFTWGAAISATTVFVAIAIPLAIMLAFMSDVLKVQTNLSIPSVKCFDKNTTLKLKTGEERKIIDINVGDVLDNDDVVTSKIKVTSENSIMYNLNNVIVSDSHVVKHCNNWISVATHPDAFKILSYNEPYLYCVNTSSKKLLINGIIFTDWDEIYNIDLENVINNEIISLKNTKDIHAYLDSGFCEKTIVKLKDGKTKNISEILIGDILEQDEIVYGIVEIEGLLLNKQFKYYLGNKCLEGGPNLCLCDKIMKTQTTLNILDDVDIFKKEETNIKHIKLFHLLTNVKSFTINNIKFHDYNTSIDIFLERNKVKLLSMKYV